MVPPYKSLGRCLVALQGTQGTRPTVVSIALRRAAGAVPVQAIDGRHTVMELGFHSAWHTRARHIFPSSCACALAGPGPRRMGTPKAPRLHVTAAWMRKP